MQSFLILTPMFLTTMFPVAAIALNSRLVDKGCSFLLRLDNITGTGYKNDQEGTRRLSWSTSEVLSYEELSIRERVV